MRKIKVPDGWDSVRLKEICNDDAPIMYGILQPGPEIDGGVPYVRPSEIDNGTIKLNEVKYTSPGIALKYKRSTLKPGDLLITIVGTLGKIAEVPDELDGANITQSSARIRLNADIACKDYIRHYLRSNYANQQYNWHRLGTGVPRLNIHHVRDLQIPLPPLSEQKRIADILNKADAIHCKRQIVGNLTQDVPLAAFRETFAEFFEPKRIDTVLIDTAEVVSGVAKGRKLNGEEIREVPYLRVANVQAGFLDLTEIKTILAKQSEVDAIALQHGDVVLTEGGDHDKLGRGALWEHDVPDCIHQNHVFRVRVDRKRLLPTFFVHFLQTDIAKTYFLRCAKKTTNLASINMTQLRALPVPLPPLKLQKRFDQEFRTVTNVIERQANAEREADNLFNSLVQRAFKGEL
jgi:type I restriction enzyme S subunit